MNASVHPPEFLLDRNEAVPQLVGRHEDFLIVAGLAGTARDLTFLSRDAPHVFALAGAMGSATSIGLGLGPGPSGAPRAGGDRRRRAPHERRGRSPLSR